MRQTQNSDFVSVVARVVRFRKDDNMIWDSWDTWESRELVSSRQERGLEYALGKVLKRSPLEDIVGCRYEVDRRDRVYT